MKYVLKEPIPHGTEMIKELEFRERVVSGDIRDRKTSAFSDPKIDDLLTIGGRLCAQSDKVMNSLGMEDTDAVGALVWGFITAGRKTGTEPSQS